MNKDETLEPLEKAAAIIAGHVLRGIYDKQEPSEESSGEASEQTVRTPESVDPAPQSEPIGAPKPMTPEQAGEFAEEFEEIPTLTEEQEKSPKLPEWWREIAISERFEPGDYYWGCLSGRWKRNIASGYRNPKDVYIRYVGPSKKETNPVPITFDQSADDLKAGRTVDMETALNTSPPMLVLSEEETEKLARAVYDDGDRHQSWELYPNIFKGHFIDHVRNTINRLNQSGHLISVPSIEGMTPSEYLQVEHGKLVRNSTIFAQHPSLKPAIHALAVAVAEQERKKGEEKAGIYEEELKAERKAVAELEAEKANVIQQRNEALKNVASLNDKLEMEQTSVKAWKDECEQKDAEIARLKDQQRVYSESFIAAVQAERDRQDNKWGGPDHDDQHSVADFVRFIKNYASWADQMADMQSYDKATRRLIQVAAMAVAAAEMIDRKWRTQAREMTDE